MSFLQTRLLNLIVALSLVLSPVLNLSPIRTGAASADPSPKMSAGITSSSTADELAQAAPDRHHLASTQSLDLAHPLARANKALEGISSAMLDDTAATAPSADQSDRATSFFHPAMQSQVGVVRHEEDDPVLLYNGVPLTATATSWYVTSWDMGRASEGYVAQSRTASDTVSLTFQGTWVGVGFATQSNAGRAQVFLDGVSQGEVDTYSPVADVTSRYYGGLISGTHTLSVTVLGTHNATASDSWVSLDYLDTWDGASLPDGWYEENEARVWLSANWSTRTDYTGASGGQYINGGSNAWFPFTGDSVTYQAIARSDLNKVKIFIDGRFQGYFNLWNATTLTRTFSFEGLGSGVHVMQVEAYRGYATLDAFGTPRSGPAYQPATASGVVRHEEDDPALLYNGVPLTATATSWYVTSWDMGRASQGYIAQSRTTSDTVSLTFQGRWVGVGFATQSNAGRAQVFLDGVSQGEVDTYSPVADVTSRYYGGLISGTHTLSVTVLGTHNATASDSWVSLDYLDTWDGTSLPDGWYEENEARVWLSANWSPRTDYTGASGGQYINGGSNAWFPFTGDSVTYQAIETSWAGQVQILIDGQSQGNFNLSNPTFVTRTFSFGNLPHTGHIIQIKSVDGSSVTLDAFTTSTTVPPDLSVTQSTAKHALAGKSLTYTLTLRKDGVAPAQNVLLTDTLPSGVVFVNQTSALTYTQIGQAIVWQFGTLSAITETTINLVVTIPPTVANHSQLINQTVVGTSSTEDNLTNNVSILTSTVSIPQPTFQVTPSYSTITLKRSVMTDTVALSVLNTGATVASSIAVLPPPHMPWVSVSPANLPDLWPGQSAIFTATLAPQANLPIGIYRDLITVQAGSVQQQAAVVVRVVDMTRTLALSVTDSFGQPVLQTANVYLVQQDESPLVTEGVTATLHQQFQAQAPNGSALLPDLDAGVYQYTISAYGYGGASGVVTVTDGSGPQPLSVALTGLPLLVPDPFYPEISVRPGETGSYQAVIRNTGLMTATHIQVTTPAALPWLYAGVAGSTEALGAGQALSVTLYASPPPTLTVPADYQQYVAVTADGGLATRFALTVHVTDQTTGTLQLQVTDANGTPLAGTPVGLISKQSTLVVTGQTTQTVYSSFTGATDANGVATFKDITAGDYTYHTAAAGYDNASGEVHVNRGDSNQVTVPLNPWPFQATWNVQPITITDNYAAILTMTFEADRLQVLPVYVNGDCDNGGATGVIQVRNASAYSVTGVVVNVNVPNSSFAVSGPSSIAAGATASYDFTAQVNGPGVGRVTAAANEMLSGRSPAVVVVNTSCDSRWNWGWGGGGGGAVGNYVGPNPSFGGVLPPPSDNPDAIAQIQLSQNIALERQAFQATLTLNAEAEVNNLSVYISASDANGEDAQTAFTITPTVPTVLPDLPAGGSVTQHWTIVPADLGITAPALYTLKAKIVYTDNEGTPIQLMTLPAQVWVYPQPEVHLTYEAPLSVRANTPVLLAVTADNRGEGTAQHLRIQAVQPVMVDRAEAPISFQIVGTEVAGTIHMGETLLDFGDIAPGTVITGGWLMQISKHGRFTDLQVDCAHQDYQGMSLSNLIYCNGKPVFHDNNLQHLNCDECPIITQGDKKGTAGGPIDTQSGNYYYRQFDLSIATAGERLQMIRSYNSSEVTTTLTNALSPGWTHHYALRLFLPGTTTGSLFATTTGNATIDNSTIYYRPVVEAQLAGGSRIRFAQNADGTFTTYPGAQATLTRQQDGSVVTYTMTASNQTAYVFNRDGRLMIIRDPHGNETRLTYDGSQRLSRVSDPTGLRWLDFTYDAQDRIVALQDPMSRTIQYGYDPSSGDLTLVTNTLGLTWTYVYTGNHLLHAIYNPAGELVEMTGYTAATLPTGESVWRATEQHNGAGIQTTLAYGGNGQTTITEAGQIRTDTYDVFGALTSQTNALGQTQSYAPNANFRRESTVNALGNQTRMTWSANGFNLTSMTDALGNTTHLEYAAANHLTAYTVAGHTTQFDYVGNLLMAQTNALSQTTRYAYDQWGHVISTTTPSGQTTQSEYDEVGQQTAVTDSIGLVTHYGYDAVGRLITMTAPTDLVTVNEYDEADHLIRVTVNYTTAGGQNYLNEYNLITTYGYDKVGRQVAVTDTLGRVNTSVYDHAGRLRQSIQNVLPGQPQNYLNSYNLVTEYGYDTLGRQYLVTDTLGHTTLTEYDALNRPVTVTTNFSLTGPIDAATNLTRTTGYDANGDVVTTTDTLGRMTVTGYDKVNRPVTVTTNYVDGVYDPNRPDEDLTSLTVYDESGQATAQRDAAGHWSYSAYDELGRLITSTNALSGTSVTVYNELGQRSKVQDAGGNWTTFDYDQFGRLITTTDALSGTSVTVYDDLGRRAAAINALEQRTVYTYSLTGRLSKMQDAGGRITEYGYDVLGRTIVVTDALGHATRTAYDVLGRVVTVTDALTGTTVTEYDALGRRSRIQDARGNWTAFEYDALGRVITTTDPMGHALVSVYDRAGNTVETRSCYAGACQTQSTFEYDKLGRLIAHSDALSNTTRYGYDAAGQRVNLIDANGIETRYGYDALSRLISVTENYSATGPSNYQTNLVTQYEYDSLGNRTVMTNARGYTTTTTYDALSRAIAVSDPLNHTTHYGYDALGNRAVMTDANGAVTLYAYDAVNRPLAITYTADLATVLYTYDAVGNRTAMTDSLGVTRYVYDELNRLTSVTDPFTGTVTYAYDANGNRTQLIYPDGKVVTSTYDAANRLTNVFDWNGQPTTYDYDAVGRLVTTTLPNSVSTAYTYDAANRLIALTHTRDNGATLVGRYEFTLDALGNRTAVTETMRSAELAGQSAALPTMANEVLVAVTGHRPPGLSSARVVTWTLPALVNLIDDTLQTLPDDATVSDSAADKEMTSGAEKTVLSSLDALNAFYESSTAQRIVPSSPASKNEPGEVEPILLRSDLPFKEIEPKARTSGRASALVPSMFAQTPPIGFERHEENIGIVYTPSAWGIWNDGRASRGSYAGSNTAGQTASLTFTGTWAGVGFLVTADGGQAEVFLDGLSQGVVDNYGHDVNVASWYYRDLVSATHTISISVLSTRHANSSGNWVRLDYIDTWDGSDIPGGSFEENNSRVISSGNWAQDSSASASGGQYYRDGTALWFPFTGSSVTYQALATYWAGEVEVLLDGQLQGRMNLQSDTTMTRTFSFGNLADSAHVLQVRNYRGRATVDAFLTPGTMPYYQPPTHTGLSRYEEDDAALRYNGASYSQMPQTWNIWNDGGLLSDGYAVFTNYSNQTVTLVFTGTWAGLGYVSRYNGGQVEVLLDGVSQGTLDTYTPANIPQSVYYDNLGAGQHTLTVRTLGTQNPNSSGTHFYFDYFDVWDGSSLPSGTSETPFAATWNWASGTDASASGGQYYRDGTALWFPFTGQSVTYQALATYWAGEVEVSIDGTTHGTVSLYAPTTVTRTFDYTGLGAGAHVLRVQASSGRATVDAVIVPPTSQPTVDFEATPMTGFAPLVVTFTNQTVPTATISSYQWNFGDGYTATVTNPVHVYSSTGVFTVALTASTSDAQVAVTKTNYITVTAAPIITTVVVITYTYDPLNRLTDATYSDGQQFQYAYDAVGNRTTQTATITSTQVTNYVYDAANRLTSVNGQAYTWDDNGNLVNDGAKTYTYNQANQLTNLTQGATTFQFAYNGDGARLKQIVNGTVTTYTLDLAAPLVQVLMMQDTGGKTAYLYGVTRIGEQQSAGWLYHLSDALGSVRQLADSSGNVQLARGYTPYGEPLWTNGTASSRYAFTGEDYDPTVGLVFLRARYLQPTLGIFLARDPWSGEATRPGSMNGWNYVEGDPIDRADPTGLCRLLKFPVFSVNLPMCVVEPDDWMWKIARQYGIEPVYFVSSNEAFLRTQGVTNMHDIDPGMLVLIPHVPGTGSSTMPHPVPGSFQGSWGGYLYGTFTQFTRPHIGNKSLAWDLQGWCDDPPIAGEGNETVIDMGRGEKATYKYYYVAKSKGSSGVLAVSLGEYAGLITGFTDGPQSITLNEYAGLSVCTVVPWGYGDVPGLSTTKLFGVGVAVGLCGPGKFTGPWTADYSNAPGLWTAVIQGTFSIGLSVDTTSEVIVNYIRTSPVMRANQTEMNDAYTYIHTYGK